MGSFGPAFLQALAGQATGGIGGPTSPVGVVPPENGMSEAVMGFPSVPMGNRTVGYGGGPNPDGSMSAVGSGGGQADEVEAVIRGFTPKKISFWGALGDQLLKHWGNKPAFQERIDNKNMMKAMEGFTGDPLEAIRRIGQIPGRQEQALKLLNEYEDNRRLRELQESTVMTRREKVVNRANQIFGGVAEDGSNWPAIRQLYLTQLERNGITDAYVPEEWDPDFMKAQIASGMTYTQQDQARYRQDRLKQIDEAEQGRNDRFYEGQNRQDARAATAEAGKDRRAASSGGGKGKAPTANKKEPGLRETDVVRPGEEVQIMREGNKIIAARVKRKDQYGRDDYIMLSPAALQILKQQRGQ